MSSKFKTRTIPFCEYFDNLQREYIVAELRFKIYPREKDKEYYRDREMLGKRKTIEDISLRNNLTNIFNSPEKYKKFKKEIYNEIGLPNFIYRNEEDRLKRRPQDVFNYFAKGSSVTIIDNDCCLKGKVLHVDLKSNTATVEVVELSKVIDIDLGKMVRYDLF